MCFSFVLRAQETPPAKLSQDSTKVSPISNASDSFRVSKDAISVPIDFAARDSVVYRKKDNRLRMYGRDSVVTKGVVLTAGYLDFDLEKSEALAKPLRDTSGRLQNYPHILEGSNDVDAKELRFNFKTRKGIVSGARTQEGDLFIVGSRSKIITKDKEPGDTTNNSIFYDKGAIFSTCDHPEPHFGIRSTKLKMIPNEWAVMGPSYVELAGVPTPLVLPFAAVPLKKGRRTGLLFPRDYEFSPNLGFGLRNIGYYFPINEYWDVQLTTDIYLRGSFGLRSSVRYNKKYKYRGNLNLGFSSFRTELIDDKRLIQDRDNSYNIQWTHNQDPKAHPTNSFSASVNIQTNDYARLNRNNANSVLQNSFYSNVNFTKRFTDRNWLLTAEMRHSQNTANRDFQISFPVVNFTTNQFKPFEREEAVGKERWYEKITMNYSGQALNRLITKDSLLFTPESWDQMRYGISHAASVDANFRILKYFTVTPRVSYNEDWLFHTLRRDLNPDSIIIRRDTTFNPIDSTDFNVDVTRSYNDIIERTVEEFRALRTVNAGVNINTQIFGTMRFRKGWLRGLRHVLKPSASLTYNPNYVDPFWNYYDRYQSDLRPNQAKEVLYNYFEESVFNRQPSGNSSLILNYNLNNIFEAKLFSKKDSTENNIKLFQNFVVSGNYDFFRDSLKWSDVRFTGYFPIFKNIINFRFNGSFSPYAVNEQGQTINTFYWNENRRLLRFQMMNMEVATQFSVKQIRETISGIGRKERSAEKEDSGPAKGDRSIWSLVDDLRVRHNLNLSWVGRTGQDTFFIRQHQISVQGNIPLTDKWNIQIGRIGYDFQRGRITYPDFGFTRDLHCWEMSLRWQPEINTYMFSIYAKPGSLDFMKIPYQRNRVDGQTLF